MIMNFVPTAAQSNLTGVLDAEGTLARLIGNLRGFAYRRRPDACWTMEFISDGCREVTGYDSHRFIANASIAFADLIAPADLERVNERVQLALRRGHRAAVDYRLRTAHGAWVPVEDRLTPILDAAGQVLGIDGIIAPVDSGASSRDQPAPGRQRDRSGLVFNPASQTQLS
jgi:PAS domain S-box-containing protein